MDRRDFLQKMGLISSATLLSSCGSEKEQKKLISYLVPPEDGTLPGEATWHPSTCAECPAGCGILVRMREGRPVKVEGNPGHPISDGGLCMRGQASLWRIQNPDRIVRPMRRREDGGFSPISWEDASSSILEAQKESRIESRKNVFLSGRTTGTLDSFIDLFCSATGVERLPEFELYSHAALREAYLRLFGRDDLPSYRMEEADFFLSIGADLLDTWVSPVSHGRLFARRAERAGYRWLHLEPHLSLTGANADRRIAIAPGSEATLLAYLLKELARDFPGGNPLPEPLIEALPPMAEEEVARRTGVESASLREILAGLKEAKRPLLVVGGVSTAGKEGLWVATLAALIQWRTRMTDSLIDFSRRENYRRVGSLADLEELGRMLEAEEVGVAFFARANPAYHHRGFAEALSGAKLKVGLCETLDETSREFDLLLPLAISLESWGDAEPRGGVRSLIRPLLEPPGEALSEGDILLRLWKEAPFASYEDFLFSRWKERYAPAELEAFSELGYIEEEREPAPVTRIVEGAEAALNKVRIAPPLRVPALLIVPSIRTFDGRGRSIPLLSEIPDPLTTITYGNWVSVSPATAEKMKIEEGEEIDLAGRDFSGRFAVKIQPGLAEGIFVVQRPLLPDAPFPLGGEGLEAPCCIEEVALKKRGRSGVPILSGSMSQQGRGIVREPVGHEKKEEHRRPSLYPEHDHPDYRWAMAIDLHLCTGCGACAAACYVENNVPLVGREDHLRGREMSWLRLEPFYDAEGKVEFVPMLCQHCHSAPCEPVCPVYAAYHNGEGLNVQVYARCVGTRYCSNNCPYKVRRFNWWQHRRSESAEKALNPDVPVRDRGVMEKCTFCVQRIRAAKDRAWDEGRKVEDGEVVTACAQSCPTGAIVFGNILDENSRISRLARSERAYRVFEELGTEPSVYYLKRRF